MAKIKLIPSANLHGSVLEYVDAPDSFSGTPVEIDCPYYSMTRIHCDAHPVDPKSYKYILRTADNAYPHAIEICFWSAREKFTWVDILEIMHYTKNLKKFIKVVQDLCWETAFETGQKETRSHLKKALGIESDTDIDDDPYYVKRSYVITK